MSLKIVPYKSLQKKFVDNIPIALPFYANYAYVDPEKSKIDEETVNIQFTPFRRGISLIWHSKPCDNNIEK